MYDKKLAHTVMEEGKAPSLEGRPVSRSPRRAGSAGCHPKAQAQEPGRVDISIQRQKKSLSLGKINFFSLQAFN